LATTKFDIEKFLRNMSFAMWQVNMKAILTQNNLYKLLLRKDQKPTTMDEDKWAEIDEKALSAIQLYLSNEVLHEVFD
jgi:hypothetical protein